ncbi:LysR substrate-binding domain-containing protein [Vibrio kyushuensis]|uniref:LysR family transcriptional regulator n=1 Tax=Vibrio kyushuensis TaxID=2910249 RepID=UPI003D0B97E7
MLINYLKAIAIFSTVAETESFTEAGRKLQMPRGKVSEQVAKLEAYLGVKLLQRSTRRVSITAEGQALYQQVQGLLPSAIQGVDEVKSFNSEIKGVIRLTTTQDHYETLLLPLLKQFSELYPKVQFDLVISEEPLSIIDESIDLAIRSGDLPDSNLVSLPLTSTQLKLYASPLLKELPVRPEQLPMFPWVSLSTPNIGNNLTLQNSSDDVVQVIPVSQHKANNIASYIPLLQQGFGIGVLAEVSARELVKKKLLIPVLSKWHVQQLQLSLIYPARLHMAKRTRLLLDFIRNNLGD